MCPANIDRFHKITVADPTTVILIGVGRGDELHRWKRQYPNARFIGVEPLREHLRFLKERWLWKPEDLLGCALAGRRGKRILHCNYEPDQRATLYPLLIPLDGEHIQKVRCITLNGLRERTKPWGQRVLIWIDTEGAEAEIFDAAENGTLANVQWINTELSFLTPRPDAALHNDVDAILRRLGYRLFAMHSLTRNGRMGDGIYVTEDAWLERIHAVSALYVPETAWRDKVHAVAQMQEARKKARLERRTRLVTNRRRQRQNTT